jgi:hypothetical protein
LLVYGLECGFSTRRLWFEFLLVFVGLWFMVYGLVKMLNKLKMEYNGGIFGKICVFK